MKASELRVHNLVQDGFKDSDLKEPDYIRVCRGSLICALQGRCEFTPIPLTEEWLVKFGFRFDDECTVDMRTTDYSISILNCESEERLSITVPFGHCEIGDEDEESGKYRYVLDNCIDYVHQLQNLYFALTGEELKTQDNESI